MSTTTTEQTETERTLTEAEIALRDGRASHTYRMEDTRADILRELDLLSKRAAEHAATLRAHPESRPSDFAELTPDLVRLIDSYSQQCEQSRWFTYMTDKIVRTVAVLESRIVEASVSK